MKFFDIENKYKILLVFFILKICFIHIDMAEAKSWQELKGDHFIVFFIGEDKFAEEVLDNAEVYYKRIAFKLGYDRYSDFWTWDKRVNIYIYRDHNAYLKFSGQPDWSHGMADYTNKQILSYIWGKNFIESLLPHEIAHLVFRDFVGFKGEVPLWLDEGVAQWAEKENVMRIYNNLVKGGILLIDNYGQRRQEPGKVMADDAFSAINKSLIALPTGQAMIIKK